MDSALRRSSPRPTARALISHAECQSNRSKSAARDTLGTASIKRTAEASNNAVQRAPSLAHGTVAISVRPLCGSNKPGTRATKTVSSCIVSRRRQRLSSRLCTCNRRPSALHQRCSPRHFSVTSTRTGKSSFTSLTSQGPQARALSRKTLDPAWSREPALSLHRRNRWFASFPVKPRSS